jgi:hypothetical protein
MRRLISRAGRRAGLCAGPLRSLGLLLIFTRLLSAAGGGKVSAMVIVADSRNLTGIRAWWANMYNESHMSFALLTILVIPLAGVILGTIADLLMSRIGIDLKSRVLRES